MRIDLFLSSFNGIVLRPACKSDSISLISKGIVIAKIKKKRSVKVAMTLKLNKELSL